MAEKTLVDPHIRFFEAVEEIVGFLNKAHGPLYLAMLMHFPDRPGDEWTLVVGSKPLVEARLKGFSLVANAVQSKLPGEFAKNIRRIGIVRGDDPFVRAVTRAVMKPVGGHVVIHNSAFDDVEIEHAALYVAGANGKTAPSRDKAKS